MNRTILILYILGLSLMACGKKEPVNSESQQVIEQFFEQYGRQGPKASLTALLRTNKYIANADVDSVSAQLERMTRGLGDYQGYEKISDASYGSGVTYHVYIAKYMRQPLRFHFTFYKPGDVWRIQNFRYESNYLDEMEETGKPFRLRENHDR